MSQKALNNTTDQYISRLMGFSRGGRGGSRVCSVSCTHANSQKRKGIENSPERSRTGTHQSTMWHMAASSTAESVKRQMEQWEVAHLRTNYDIVFSFAKSRGVDLNYGASSPALPFVLPQVFLSFFFPRVQRLALQAAARDHKLMARRRIRASMRKADGRGMCAFVQTLKPHLSRVRWRGPDAQNEERTARIPLHRLVCEFTADFN